MKVRNIGLVLTCSLILISSVPALGQEQAAARPALSRECCAPLPPDLADWWTFDEPSGPSSSDIGGSVNNAGTDNGAIPRIGGVVGRAVDFNKTWISVKDQAEVDFSGNCENDAAEAGTIDFWIRTTETGTVAVLDKRERNGNNFLRGYEVYLWRGQLGFQMATGSGNFSCNSAGSACSNFTSPLKVADGKWHFVAIAFTRCRGARGMFYVDGVTAPFQPRVGDISNGVDLLVGRESPQMGGSFFRGAVDELEIFKRALGKPELDAIWQAGSAGKCRRLR